MHSIPRLYPRLASRAGKSRAIALGGGLLLTETVAVSGLGQHLSTRLAGWAKPLAEHDPAKILCDLAIAVAAGGDCLADVGVLRGQPGVYGRVASDPTVSRLISLLGETPDLVEKAVGAAMAVARAKVWGLAGAQAPHANMSIRNPLVIDLDATLITAHSDKDQAAPTFKHGYGFHPLCGFADYGTPGLGEPVAMTLRPGNAGSNTVKDHIQVTNDALNALPVSVSKKILIRTDGAGGTQEYTKWLQHKGVQYSVGFKLPDNTPELYHLIPEIAWTCALNADGEPRQHADVAEFTGLLDMTCWPEGMRVIVRREHPHPGAQLRFDDVDGYRLTAFATNTRGGQHQQLELRHRRRARCEDRIRCAKDTGLNKLPLYSFGQNRIWLLIVRLANCLIAWAQMLAFTNLPQRLWEPKRLRLRLFNAPAEIIHSARRVIVRFNQNHPWVATLAAALARLRAFTST